MDDTVVVSVIIPSKNAAVWLPDQLGSLADQVEAPPFEVIISDNGSTDGTCAVVQAFEQRLRLKLVDATGPASASFARNVGAQAAQGEFLLFCDADDIVSPNWVGAMTAAVRSRGNVIAAGALHHEQFNSPAVLDAYGISRDPALPAAPAPVIENPPGFAGFLPTVPGGNFAIERAAYLGLGGMDWSYPGGSEETDFAWRAQLAGLGVVTVSHAVVQYRLKHDVRAIFRQQRIQQRGRVLLWVRFSAHGMSGPSWRHSLHMSLASAIRLLLARSERTRLGEALTIGGHVGALEGMLLYRFFRARPGRRLMSGSNPF